MFLVEHLFVVVLQGLSLCLEFVVYRPHLSLCCPLRLFHHPNSVSVDKYEIRISQKSQKTRRFKKWQKHRWDISRNVDLFKEQFFPNALLSLSSSRQKTKLFQTQKDKGTFKTKLCALRFF